MPTAEALVSGAEIFRMLLTSPLILLVSLITVLLGLATLKGVLPLLTRRVLSRRARRILGATMIIIAALLPPGTALLSVDPRASYGVVLEDHTLRVTFYQDDTVEYNACNANLTLLDPREARELLKIRTYGTSDPTIGLDMGYYKLTTGENATVIALWDKAESALLIREDNKASIVAVPGVERVYEAALEACKGRAVSPAP